MSLNDTTYSGSRSRRHANDEASRKRQKLKEEKEVEDDRNECKCYLFGCVLSGDCLSSLVSKYFIYHIATKLTNASHVCFSSRVL